MSWTTLKSLHFISYSQETFLDGLLCLQFVLNWNCSVSLEKVKNKKYCKKKNFKIPKSSPLLKSCVWIC